MTDRSSPDEDSWVVPAGWWKKSVPWRGYPSARRAVPATKAVARYDEILAVRDRADLDSAAHGPRFARSTTFAGWMAATAEAGDVELAEAGVAARENPSAATPLGLAVLASGIRELTQLEHRSKAQSPIPDAWAARYGIPAAAEATVLWAGLGLGPAEGSRSHGRVCWTDGSRWSPAEPVLLRMRALLAALPDAAYAEVVTRLAEVRAHRNSGGVRRAITYLVPTEQHWVAEELARTPQRRAFEFICTVTTAEQLAAAADHQLRTDRYLYTAAAHVGPASARTLGDTLDQYANPEQTRAISGVLACFPTDEAFRLLIDRASNPLVRQALLKAMRRFPRRAMRLLPTSDQPEVRQILRAHALGHPTVAAEYGIAVEPVTDTWSDAPVATDLPDQLQPGETAGDLPYWLVPESLPSIGLREPRFRLPVESVARLCGALAAKDGHAVVAAATAYCDTDSLADFGWGIFEAWRLAEYPREDRWVLSALGTLGNDDTARSITPYIRAWPGTTAYPRAVAALDTLAAIGTGTALAQLSGIAENSEFKALKARAGAKIAEVAAGLGLTDDELADRLVPRFGLSAEGTRKLDYGSRVFVVGFDEQLRPTVADADGTPRKTLPKPGAKDDAEQAEAAYREFALLKKDVRSIAAAQIRRLESAMVRGRRWTAADHRRFLIEHPLLRHLVQRLVWAVFDDAGTVIRTFRIAEDNTLADVEDYSVVLPDTAAVGVAHPLHLADTIETWRETFADYEITQPFSQLARETYRLTGPERASTALNRFTDVTAEFKKVLGLTRRGWDRQPPQDAGVSNYVFRVFGGHSAVVELDPGLPIGMGSQDWYEQQILAIRLVVAGQEHDRYHPDAYALAFDALDPVSASELLRDLFILTA
ncbi:DUF4132 domain-containing protein [Nocardia sp. NPDC127579]|uniref:DUF4132 domain-containing protein n=1 Tax=Nocardia sp. NPDC127579 TaxID=3345402 RepID=UPI003642E09D